MNLLNQPQKYIHQKAVELGKKLETKSVRRIKRFTIIIFAILIVADIIFVLPNQFPTFSRLMLNSSPRYSFIIFLWGIMTANIFFSRKVKSPIKLKAFGLAGMIILSVALYIHGNSIRNKSIEVNCATILTQPQPAFTEIICYNSNDDKVNCNSGEANCASTKYDITTMTKLLLLVFGFVYGLIFWPQIEIVRDEGKT